MYLKDLIEKAEKALEENGNIRVAVYTDYGQSCQIAYDCGVWYRDSDGMSFLASELRERDADFSHYTKVFEIAGE